MGEFNWPSFILGVIAGILFCVGAVYLFFAILGGGAK